VGGATKPVVAMTPVNGDLRAAIGAALEAAGFKARVARGEPVALKVNLGWDLFIPGSITSPFFLEALIAEIRDHVGAIHVVESDQVLEDVERAFRASGRAEVCARAGARWVNMQEADAALVEAPENVVLKRIRVPRILREAALVTVPVMKTHAKTVLSGALKNQWGCLPKMRHEYHLVLDDAIADLNAVLRPRFAVMDATVGLEGDGPKSGHPRVVDRVLASADLVALDAVQAATMGIEPASVGHLVRSASRGLGTHSLAAIEVRGLDPVRDRVPFQAAKHNAVSLVESLLRRSWLKPLFFNTPLFKLCLWGAKIYYRIWTRRHARRCWDEVLAHGFYGPLWGAALREGRVGDAAAGPRAEPAAAR
jgi:uncharacterized protein (DUF362 family)